MTYSIFESILGTFFIVFPNLVNLEGSLPKSLETAKQNASPFTRDPSTGSSGCLILFSPSRFTTLLRYPDIKHRVSGIQVLGIKPKTAQESDTKKLVGRPFETYTLVVYIPFGNCMRDMSWRRLHHISAGSVWNGLFR